MGGGGGPDPPTPTPLQKHKLLIVILNEVKNLAEKQGILSLPDNSDIQSLFFL